MIIKQNELRDIQQSAGIGFWIWNVETDFVFWDEGMYPLYGLAPEDFHNSYEDYRCKVDSTDLIRIEKDLDDILKSRGEFVNVFKLKNGHYIKAYGSFSSENIMAGVNIRADEREYLKYLNSEIRDVTFIKNYTARKSLFDLKRQFTSPYKFVPEKTDSTEWIELPKDIIPNTKYRTLNVNNTPHLVTEWLSMNGEMETHYHEDDELITNLGESSVDVWVNGELNHLKQRDTLFIPRNQFHRVKCNGICHFMVTWFNYYSDVPCPATLR